MEAKGMLLNDVKQKLAKARELCPGMSDEVYALSDYLASVDNNDPLTPGGVVMMLSCVMDILKMKRCGFAHEVKLPKYLAAHAVQVLKQAPYILQVIDAIAEPDFAREVRNLCKEIFKWNTIIAFPAKP